MEAATFGGTSPPHCTMSLPRTYIFFFIGAAVRTTKLSKRSSVCCHMQVVWCAEDIGTELLKVTLTTTVFRLTTRGPGVPTRLGEREVGIGVEVQITDGSLRYELLWLSKRKTKLKTSQEQQWSKGHTCNGITLLASRRELRSVESKLAEVKWMDGWMDELAEPVEIWFIKRKVADFTFRFYAWL